MTTYFSIGETASCSLSLLTQDKENGRYRLSGRSLDEDA
ncbi:hypothetical protein D3OALGA1CA_448 [Olavius algarvensis associated proteobacterium Delta 3]|nr:hypothetical protein D3OALGB2SA_490 [Olavius algarvensis associated proteobacterium Delta 3]CAB5084445.1 hypothetical protein D3OALGA1CA_448 [Olavius algarvensis associated proteobacterium Delta 3]